MLALGMVKDGLGELELLTLNYINHSFGVLMCVYFSGAIMSTNAEERRVSAPRCFGQVGGYMNTTQ